MALKTLHIPSQLEEFQSEAKMLMKMKHPNVVAYFGFYKSEGEGFMMVTEYLPFGSVLELLQTRGKELTQNQLLKMAQDAAAGMM